MMSDCTQFFFCFRGRKKIENNIRGVTKKNTKNKKNRGVLLLFFLFLRLPSLSQVQRLFMKLPARAPTRSNAWAYAREIRPCSCPIREIEYLRNYIFTSKDL